LSDKQKLSPSEKAVIMVFFVGTALIIAGQFVYKYANQTVKGLETKLSQTGLSDTEYWNIKGSLDWWRQALLSLYGPISILLIATGIALLAFLIAYFVLKILRANKHESQLCNIEENEHSELEA
jgi:hypothetical protein